MIDYKDIGRRIRAVRLQRQITQEQLAEVTGVGTSHISHVETGNSIPSLQLLVDIINALNCSADELKLITDTVVAMKDSMRRLKEARR